MNSKELIKAVKLIVEEKNISEDVIYEGLSLALAPAYKKNFDSPRTRSSSPARPRSDSTAGRRPPAARPA